MDTITEERVQAAHAEGLRFKAWFRGPDTMKELKMSDTDFFEQIFSCKVDTICTNMPAALVGFLEGKSEGGKKRKSESSAERPARRFVRFDPAKPKVHALRDEVDRSSTPPEVFHCDDCGAQFAAGLRGFEV